VITLILFFFRFFIVIRLVTTLILFLSRLCYFGSDIRIGETVELFFAILGPSLLVFMFFILLQEKTHQKGQVVDS